MTNLLELFLINKVLNVIKKGLLLLLATYQPVVNANDGQKSSVATTKNFIQLGTEYEFSDNAYKSASDEESSHSLTADIEASYERLRDTNSITLAYNAEYQVKNNSRQEDNNFWIGKGTVSQQIFNKNFIFAAQHERQRFIVDQSKASTAENETERDLTSIEQYWHIPYSQRARFSLHVEHARARFNDYKSKNSIENIGDISWQHRFNKKIELTLSYSYSDNNFESSSSYQKQTLDAQLSGRHQLGVYYLSIGKSQTKYQSAEYDGLNYSFMVNALIKQHQFILSGSKALTDSSFQMSYANELDFFQNQLLWNTQASLKHQYSTFADRLLSTSSIYFSQDESISNLSSDQNTQYTGFNTQFNWKIDSQWKLFVTADYRYSELSTGRNKQLIETNLAGRFNINPSLYLQMSVNWENEEFTDTKIGYTETNYTSRIAYTF